MRNQFINVRENSVAVIGFHDGAAGQVETWFEETSGYHIACFVHEAADPLNVNIEAENKKRHSQRTDFPVNSTFKGRPLIVSLNWIAEIKKIGVNKVLPLNPNNRERLKQIKACQEQGIELISAIHPSVTILKGATIQPGVWINAGCLIGYKAEIETGVIINTRAQVDHHNVLKRCCQLDPAVVTAGNVTLQECCHIHTGTVIINRIEIGEDAVVGAGAVVIRNVPPHCTVVGVPAKVIKGSDNADT